MTRTQGDTSVLGLSLAIRTIERAKELYRRDDSLTVKWIPGHKGGLATKLPTCLPSRRQSRGSRDETVIVCKAGSAKLSS